MFYNSAYIKSINGELAEGLLGLFVFIHTNNGLQCI